MARREPSLIRRAGTDRKLSVPSSKCTTKVVRYSVVVGMAAAPVGGGDARPSARPAFVKRSRTVETATCAAAAREKKPAARRARADERVSAPSPKRAKVARGGVEASVGPALGNLRKRMAAELDALHVLLRKADLLSSGKNGRSMAAAEPRSEAPMEASIKTPPAKRTKVYDLAKVAEFESPEDKNELIDICGGVSLEKAGETGSSEIKDPPEDDNEFIDICGGVSPVAVLKASPIVSLEKVCGSGNSPSSSSDSGSSSSSDSDSDSDSESNPNETVGLPVPQAVLPVEENGTSAQPAPEPASEVVRRRTEPEKLPTAALIAKAKVRRQLLEMERAALADESINPQDLMDLCIAEYGRPGVMRQLGLFLKADA